MTLIALSERYEGHIVVGAHRPLVILATVALIVLFEGLLLLWLFRGRKWPDLAAFLLAHALALSFFFLGELKVNYSQYVPLPWSRAEPPFEEFAASGDPNLADWFEQGTPEAPPPLASPVQELRDWQRGLRTELRHSLLGSDTFPSREKVTHTVLSETMVGGGVRRKFISFPGFEGTPIPAYLFEPDTSGVHPAILVLAGHGRGILETAGLVPSYQHAVARELARAGFVTLAPELRGFGYLGPRIGTDHCIVAFNAVGAGSSYAGVIARDLKKAVDVMLSLPIVDSLKVGVTGASMGGSLSLVYGALDERIRAVAAQSTGIDILRHHGLRESWNRRITPETPFCHLVPGARRLLAEQDLVKLIAPRPLLLTSGLRETSQFGGMHPSTHDAIVGFYGRVAAEDRISIEEIDGGHEYFVQPAIDFFRSAFAGPGSR